MYLRARAANDHVLGYFGLRLHIVYTLRWWSVVCNPPLICCVERTRLGTIGGEGEHCLHLLPF